jgi:hypothetical protein
MMNTAIRDTEGKSIISIKVTHENKQSESNHCNIVAEQFVVKLLWGIFLLFTLDYIINLETKLCNSIILPVLCGCMCRLFTVR